MIVCKKCIKSLLICVAVCLPCFSVASWSESACRSVGSNGVEGCSAVSNNYTQPYCITNVNRNFGDGDVDNVMSCLWPNVTNTLSTGNTNVTTKGIIEKYCHSLLSELNEWRIYFAKSNSEMDEFDWQQTFDSHQSLFLSALCWSFKVGKNTPFLNWNEDFFSDVYAWDIVKILKLQQNKDWKDFCSLKNNDNDNTDNDLNDCDLGIYVTKIFEWIMSDLFKIKYAEVLHVDTNEKYNSNEKVENFMKEYFSISGWYKDLKKNYSKTISILESDQKYYKDVLSSVRIINTSKLAGLVKEGKCPVGWNVKWSKFVACALHSFQWSWSPLTPSFLALVYNELLHYRLFVSYYAYAIRQKNLDNEERLNNEVKILDFQKYSDMQVEAFKLAQHGFEEFSMTYPLHIRIHLYMEKVEKFRNDGLSKVVTLFYSLSEKLKNVQEPTS